MAAARPVILLAFANDSADGINYLRNLPEEARRLRAALEYAEAQGLCEFEVRYNATLDDILAAFQHPKLRGRVAVFHYGGHAESYDLLFQSGPGNLQRVDGRGFAAFLAEQRGLQLVFLNACTTEPQVDSLLAANVPVVIATSQEVDDSVAAELAARFYGELAHGASVGASYRQAVAALRAAKGEDPALFYAPGGAPPAAPPAAPGSGGDFQEVPPPGSGAGSASGGYWPWLLRTRPGAETAIEWSLPQAAGDPLFGLPPLPPKPLPASPYQRGLDYYTRDLAELFFGRGRQIRDLYQRVTAAGHASVILYYGQSGVGKSSLLDAGLAPRLAATHAVLYARRDRTLGLLGTLHQQLAATGAATGAAADAVADAAAPATVAPATAAPATVAPATAAPATAAPATAAPVTAAPAAAAPAAAVPVATGAAAPAADVAPALVAAWLAAEQRLGKPVVLILDQVEEVFSRRNPDRPQELAEFAAALAGIDAGPHKPAGALLLGFRKERLAEIETALRDQHVDFAKLFLGPLDVEGIQEVFWGPVRNERLKTKYNLSVDDDLPEVVAHDLTADPDSPVAPTLNILLRKLWAAATAQAASAPRFTVALYEQLRRDGILLDDFLRQQTATLAQEQPDSVASGLLLDLWAFHTTALGTSDQRDAAEVKAAYGHQPSVEALILRSKELYVLADPPGDTTGGDTTGGENNGGAAGSNGGTRLAHDTLAPLVRRDYATSALPGQQARRLLESRAIDWEAGRSGPLLDDAALAVIDKGLAGMRGLSEAEGRLLAASRAAQAQRVRSRRLWRGGAAAAALVVLALLAATFLIWDNGRLQSERADREVAERIAAEAERQTALERADREAAERQAAEERTRAGQLSTQLANERERAAARAAQVNESQRLAALAQQQLASDPVTGLHLALAAQPPAGQSAVPEADYALRQAVLTSRERAWITTTVNAPEAVAVRGNRVAVGGLAPAVYTLDLQAEDFALPPDFTDIRGLRWGNDGRLLGWSRDRAWVAGGGEPQQFALPAADDEIRCAEWQPAQQWVAICTYNALYAWQPANGRVITLTAELDNPDAPTERRGAAWSADGRLLAGWGAKLAVWDSRNPQAPAQVYDEAPEPGSSVAFAFWLPEDNALLAGWSGPAARGLHVVRWAADAAALAPVLLTPDVDDYTQVEAIYAPFPLEGEPRLLLWSYDGLLAFYTLAGEQLAAAPADGTAINGVALAPGGGKLVVYAADGSAIIYANSSWVPLWRLDAAHNFVADLLIGASWLGDDALLLLDRSGLLQLVSMPDAAGDIAITPLARLGEGERLAAAAGVAGGRLLTAGYADGGGGSLRLWQAQPVLQRAGAPALPAPTAPLCERLHRAVPLPDGIGGPQALAWEGGDHLLVLHDGDQVAHWTPGGDFTPLPSDPTRTELAFAPDGTRLLRYGASGDGQLWGWNGAGWEQGRAITGSVAAAVWTAHGLLLQFAGELDDPPLVFDPDSGERRPLPPGTDLDGATLIDPDHLVALREDHIELWRIGEREPLAAWPVPAGRFLYLADVATGEAAAEGAGERLLVYQDWQLGQLYVLRADAAAGTLVEAWRAEEAHINLGPARLHPRLPLLATINDSVLAVVDLAQGARLWTSRSAAPVAAQLFRAVQWSTDGQYLITQAQLPQTSSLEENFGVWRWDAAQGAPVLLQEMRGANLVGVRPDMQWLLASEPAPFGLRRVVAYPLLLDGVQLRQDVQSSCLLVRPLSAVQQQAYLIDSR